MRKLSVLVVFMVLTGCVTTPTGEQRLSPEGQAALMASTRIAMRHFLDDPRAGEKAANVRQVVSRLEQILSAESTLAALVAESRAQIDRLNLSALQRADAQDLLTLLEVALEARLGKDAFQSEGLTVARDFLREILVVLPPA